MKLLRSGLFIMLLVTVNSLADDIVSFGSSWSYLNPQTLAANPGTVDANFDANWFTAGFNMAAPNAWSGPSPGPFSRVDDSGIANVNAFKAGNSNFIRDPGTLLDTPVTDNRGTAYFRHEFTTAAPRRDFALEFLADDGVQFYLDGQPLYRNNCCLDDAGEVIPVGTPPVFSSVSTTSGSETAYTLAPVLLGQELAAGDHVLSASVHNRTFRDSDLGFSARLLDGYIYRPLIESASEWNYWEGDAEPSDDNLDWTGREFSVTRWETGQEGIGYDTDAATNALSIINTELESMQNVYSSVYLRHAFSIPNVDELSEMELTIDFDDSFIAYVNGKEVARSGILVDDFGIDESVPYDTLGASHESSNGIPNDPAIGKFKFSLADIPDLMAEGNVLAIQGFNTTLDSSDFVLAQISLAGIGGGGTGGLAGDFDGNGVRDAADIDMLSAAVRSGNGSAEFDVNGDGAVNNDDRVFWVETIKNTYLGDSNLDGQFSTSDFVAVFEANEFEDGIPLNSGWATGDWDGNGDFGTGDFVLAFQGSAFEQGARPGGINPVASVPEPTSVLGVVIATIGLVWIRRRR